MTQTMITFKDTLEELFTAHSIVTKLCDEHDIIDPKELLSININQLVAKKISDLESKIKSAISELEEVQSSAADVEGNASSACDSLSELQSEVASLIDSEE